MLICQGSQFCLEMNYDYKGNFLLQKTKKQSKLCARCVDFSKNLTFEKILQDLSIFPQFGSISKEKRYHVTWVGSRTADSVNNTEFLNSHETRFSYRDMEMIFLCYRAWFPS